MILTDYIRGIRHGRQAHDIELDAMTDPLLWDALDGFGAVPGEHDAALERLAGRIDRSALSGRAARLARSRHLRERRIRVWSVSAAAVFLAGIIGGGVFMMRGDAGAETGLDSSSGSDALAGRTTYNANVSEQDAILPPVTVVPNETDSSEATDISALEFDELEITGVPKDVTAMRKRTLPDEFSASAPSAITSSAAPHTFGESAVPAVPDSVAVPAGDSTMTVEFRRFVSDFVAETDSSTARSVGYATVTFKINDAGRPEEIIVTDASSVETGDEAVRLLHLGPDWPTEPAQKLITIKL